MPADGRADQNLIRAHIFTNIPEITIFKQSPGFSPVLNGVHFTHGLEIPEDGAIDVLLMYTRASYSVPTRLPEERTIFFAGEPDVIHSYNPKFLNQFGVVYTSSPVVLETEKIEGHMCCMPFVGLDFPDFKNPLSLDWFGDLECPTDKDDKISIVTSTKVFTPYHKARMAFIEVLKEKIPEHIRLYGFGHKQVNDKKDSLLPSKYHLAMENGGGPHAWTEKLADPLLCYALPFYNGCNTVGQDLPQDCIVEIDVTKPDQAIEIMQRAIKDGAWEKRLEAIREARQLLLTKHNLMYKFAELVHRAMEKAPDIDLNARRRLIRSERSFLPHEGGRGGLGQMLLRRAMTAVDPRIELKIAPLRDKIEALRAEHRARRRRKTEKAGSP